MMPYWGPLSIENSIVWGNTACLFCDSICIRQIYIFDEYGHDVFQPGESTLDPIYDPYKRCYKPAELNLDMTYSSIEAIALPDYRLLCSQGPTNPNNPDICPTDNTNVWLDPEFIDNELHLDRSSRSIDFGYNDFYLPEYPDHDIDGESPRKTDGDGNLSAEIDLGADEVPTFDPDLIVANFEANPPAGTAKVNPFAWSVVLEPLTVQFTDISTGVSPNHTCHWNFGDGTTSDECNPSHSYSGKVGCSGDDGYCSVYYTVSLRVCENCMPCDANCPITDKRKVKYAIHATDLPRLIQIENDSHTLDPVNTAHRGDTISIIGWDFEDTSYSPGEYAYRPEIPGVRSVNIGDTTYSLGEFPTCGRPPDLSEPPLVCFGDGFCIIDWYRNLIRVKVPRYPESDFGGNDSITKDVSVTVNGYYTSNKVPLQVIRLFCGDGICSDSETCSSCQNDCGKCVNVLEPSGGDILYSGSVFTIMLEINKLPGVAAKEKLHYKCSPDTEWTLIKTLTCSSGLCPLTYPWQVPSVSSTKTGCKVRAKILDSSGGLLGQDSSDGYFQIQPY